MKRVVYPWDIGIWENLVEAMGGGRWCVWWWVGSRTRKVWKRGVEKGKRGKNGGESRNGGEWDWERDGGGGVRWEVNGFEGMLIDVFLFGLRSFFAWWEPFFIICGGSLMPLYAPPRVDCFVSTKQSPSIALLQQTTASKSTLSTKVFYPALPQHFKRDETPWDINWPIAHKYVHF